MCAILTSFGSFLNEKKSNITNINNFKYVVDFFSKYLPDKISTIKNIPVYIISEKDWSEGKPRQTENDRNGGIRIHENHIENDINIGWLIHEVGHVLDLNGYRLNYLVNKSKFKSYPNEDDEQTPMYYQFKYLIDRGLSEDDVIRLEKNDYSNVKGGGTLWNSYKDKFFRAFYREMYKKINGKINENRNTIDYKNLPKILYHVTTNYKDVIKSGVLLAKSGLNSGGLGGTESVGVSFVSSIEIAKNIYDELKLINDINGANSSDDVVSVLSKIDDIERRNFVIEEYSRTLSSHENNITAALMSLRLSRISSKFYGKPFYDLVIFNEENIKNKDIGIIEVSKNKIPKDAKIIEGVDKQLGEIRILNDIFI